MVAYNINEWIIWLTLVFILLILGFALFLIWIIWKQKKQDKILIIDKNNRWSLTSTQLWGRDSIEINKKKYMLTEEGGILNRRGNALYIFGENKSLPIILKHDKIQFLTSETLMKIINNKVIQKMIEASGGKPDLFLLLGAIGGIIAGLSATLLLLIQTGVINL